MKRRGGEAEDIHSFQQFGNSDSQSCEPPGPRVCDPQATHGVAVRSERGSVTRQRLAEARVTVERVSDELSDDQVGPQRYWLERLSPHQYCGHRPAIRTRVCDPQMGTGKVLAEIGAGEGNRGDLAMGGSSAHLSRPTFFSSA